MCIGFMSEAYLWSSLWINEPLSTFINIIKFTEYIKVLHNLIKSTVQSENTIPIKNKNAFKPKKLSSVHLLCKCLIWKQFIKMKVRFLFAVKDAMFEQAVLHWLWTTEKW